MLCSTRAVSPVGKLLLRFYLPNGWRRGGRLEIDLWRFGGGRGTGIEPSPPIPSYRNVPIMHASCGVIALPLARRVINLANC
jgi:hypothetical protein